MFSEPNTFNTEVVEEDFNLPSPVGLGNVRPIRDKEPDKRIERKPPPIREKVGGIFGKKEEKTSSSLSSPKSSSGSFSVGGNLPELTISPLLMKRVFTVSVIVFIGTQWMVIGSLVRVLGVPGLVKVMSSYFPLLIGGGGAVYAMTSDKKEWSPGVRWAIYVLLAVIALYPVHVLTETVNRRIGVDPISQQLNQKANGQEGRMDLLNR